MMGAYGSPDLYPYDDKQKIQRRTIKLFGFRSGKAWKKFLSILYLIPLVLLALFSLILGVRDVHGYDIIIDRVQSLLIISMLATPYIIFSDFGSRRRG